MTTTQLCRAISAQGGSATIRSDEAIFVSWPAVGAKGKYTRRDDGRWAYTGSIR